MQELLAPLQLQLCVDLGRLGLGESSARLLDGCLVSCLLDPKEQLALLNLLPFGKSSLLNEPWHPCNNVDLIDRRHASDVGARLCHLTGHYWSHRNSWRRRDVLCGDNTMRRYQDQCANRCLPTEGTPVVRHDALPKYIGLQPDGVHDHTHLRLGHGTPNNNDKQRRCER